MVGTLRLVLVILHTYIDTQRTGFQKIISGLFLIVFFCKDPIDLSHGSRISGWLAYDPLFSFSCCFLGVVDETGGVSSGDTSGVSSGITSRVSSGVTGSKGGGSGISGVTSIGYSGGGSSGDGGVGGGGGDSSYGSGGDMSNGGGDGMDSRLHGVSSGLMDNGLVDGLVSGDNTGHGPLGVHGHILEDGLGNVVGAHDGGGLVGGNGGGDVGMSGLGHGVGEGGNLGDHLGEGVSLGGRVGKVATKSVVLN